MSSYTVPLLLLHPARCCLLESCEVWALAVVLPEIALQYPEKAQTIDSNVVSLG